MLQIVNKQDKVGNILNSIYFIYIRYTTRRKEMLPILLDLMNVISERNNCVFEQMVTANQRDYVQQQMADAIQQGADPDCDAMYELKKIDKNFEIKIAAYETQLKTLNAKYDSELKLVQEEAKKAGTINTGGGG